MAQCFLHSNRSIVPMINGTGFQLRIEKSFGSDSMFHISFSPKAAARILNADLLHLNHHFVARFESLTSSDAARARRSPRPKSSQDTGQGKDSQV